MACNGCPFGCSEASEQAQNWGCLPTPMQIIEMKEKSGHNWACHSNENKICSGFVGFVKDMREFGSGDRTRYERLDLESGKLISYEEWYREGDDYAMKNAK